MSTREILRLAEIGRDRGAIMVVDNIQSGPDTGKGIAETLRAPHVVLTNFPSERGYLATRKRMLTPSLPLCENKAPSPEVNSP
jgi:zinc transport system substrate-binding protein